MINTKNEYHKRLHEVGMYFNTLRLLDIGECYIKCIDIVGEEIEHKIDNELSTILKANGFLILYNMIEATIRKSIGAVFNAIHTENVTYEKLSEEMRRLWIQQESKNITTDSVISIVNKILTGELVFFKENSVTISGNIDAQKIREILKQLGGNGIEDGRNLKTIKDKRNHLAHGEFSFSEIGRDYTVQELIKFKEETEHYLTKVLDEIHDYINQQKYLTIISL